jgi:hypothetical protein
MSGKKGSSVSYVPAALTLYLSASLQTIRNTKSAGIFGHIFKN